MTETLVVQNTVFDQRMRSITNHSIVSKWCSLALTQGTMHKCLCERKKKLSQRLKNSRGTGIRGLMKGMATLLQGNQELLVVRDTVQRPLRWAGGKQVHGMWYFSIQCFETVGWATGRACKKTGCWFVGDNLTGALHDL